MKKLMIVFLVLFPLIILGMSNPVIILKTGDVKISYDNKIWRDIEVSEELKLNGIIKTEKDSSAVLSIDDSVIKISEKSKFELSKFNKNKDGGTIVKFKLYLGKILAGISKLKKNESIDIESPTAVAGIRGTEFEIAIENEETTVKVFEGEIQFQDIRRKSSPVILKQGYMGKFSRGRIIRVRAKLKSKEIEKFRLEIKQIRERVRNKKVNKKIKIKEKNKSFLFNEGKEKGKIPVKHPKGHGRRK